LSMWLFWFVLGVALIAVETLVAFTLYAGAVALGAFPAAIVAALGASVEVQVAVFAAGAAFSLVVLRPIARRQLQTQGARTGTDALISARATVLERVDGDHGVVRIRGGDVWSARPMSPEQTFDEGAQVVVREIKGVFVLVSDPGAGDAG
jgi:membrane protein implicated in regulation of membrane protease activity